MNKNCGNCVNVIKSKNSWCCEKYGFYHGGMPVSCNPPYDDACELWTDDTAKKNTWEKLV